MAVAQESGTVPRLTVRQPARLRGREFPLNSDRALVGRQDNCDVQLDDAAVSRTHAMVLRREDGETVVCDLHSSNGTTVNGVLVDNNGQTLHPGDVVCFGAVELAFEGPGPDATRVAPLNGPAAAGGSSRAEYRIADQQAAEINNVGRDQHNAYVQQIQQERASFAREVAGATTKSRRLIWLGFILFVLGGGIYGWVILRFDDQLSRTIDQSNQTAVPALFGPNVGGVPIGLIGFAGAALGLLLLVVGLVLHIVASSRGRRLESAGVPPWEVVVPPRSGG